ncbi:hypothetical protein JAAARDRAFT_37578 [Jaapia argillacea MUCL 33604]|uniref:PinX1-related protein 1 n=1 Tax=Jaapia argillacea MUCL 33604 TaxID=933084 RepID=A0A067PUU2_9AGAM|nr:hypothetical protein JAAARDRAFT_37578 [Jaapia argillacea MUCL 33604]
MGLSGRKVKQRIGADPRNLSWSDNAAKFGQAYLEKFGWENSKGLGANADGRTTHIKASQKLDLMGIGAQHQMDPSGIAWQQNKEFEGLLMRLNQAGKKEDGLQEEEASMDTENVGDKRKTKDGGQAEDKKRKKRKRAKDQDQDQGGGAEVSSTPNASNGALTSEVDYTAAPAAHVSTKNPAKKVMGPPRSHRARLIAAKRISSKHSLAISEVLGIAPTPSSSESTSVVTSDDETLKIQHLTTSAKSVSDYFKERLLAKSSSSSGTTTPSPISESVSYDEAPRRGLGAFRMIASSQIEEITEKCSTRSGIGVVVGSTFSSVLSSSFASTTRPPPQDNTNDFSVLSVEDQVRPKLSKKKKRKVGAAEGET